MTVLDIVVAENLRYVDIKINTELLPFFRVLPECSCSSEQERQRVELIQRDVDAHRCFWSITKGESTSDCTVMMTPADVRKSKRNNRIPGNGISSRPMYSDYIDRPQLSYPLQLHFSKMRSAVLVTAHPSYIRAEALKIVFDIMISRDRFAIREVAKRLFLTGIANIEYTRTVALVIHELYVDLSWRQWVTPEKLLGELRLLVVKGFDTSWLRTELNQFQTETGIEPLSSPSLEQARSQILNLSALLGSLVALELMPLSFFHSAINFLMDNLFSLLHVRALSLMLLHSRIHVVKTLGEAFLYGCRAKIVRTSKDVACNDTLRRWYLEICDAIDKLLAREDDITYDKLHGSCVAYHRWSKSLCRDAFLVKLLEDLGPPDETVFASVVGSP